MSEQLHTGYRDNRGELWADTDHATNANAQHAAENGKWTKWAHPGFEQSAEQIGIEARIEADREDALQIPVGGPSSTSQTIEVHTSAR